MCCKSKKKQAPITQSQPPNAVYQSTAPVQTVQQSNISTASGLRVPRSNVVFGANEFTSNALTNHNQFTSTKRANQFAQGRGDRLEDYAVEANNAKESRLIQPKELLNYDLDNENGVSSTPVVNTFHYETTLQHCFLNRYNNTTNNVSNSQIYSANQNVQESQYQNRNVTDSNYINNNLNNDANQQYTSNSGIYSNKNNNPEVLEQDSKVSKKSWFSRGSK